MNSGLTIVGVMPLGGDINPDFFYYDRFKKLVDKTVVVMDNIDMDIDADYIIKLKKRDRGWNDAANRFMASIAATNLSADWIMSLDSDEDLDHRINDVETVRAIIMQSEKRGFNCVGFFLREMWENEYQYRSDGIWGRKRRIRLSKNFMKAEDVIMSVNLNKKFHAQPHVVGSHTELKRPPIRYEIYHYGCFNQEMREKRVNKYKEHDPNNEFQSIGYNYMLDYNGLEVSEVIGKQINRDK